MYLKNGSADDDLILRVTGTYSYLDEKGEYHEVNYESDENGFSLKKAPIFAVSSGVAFSEKEYGRKGISSAALASLSG